MPAGRKPEWPADVRAAVIKAVFEEGESLNGTIKRLHAGRLPRLGAVPVPLSTARSWVDTEKRQRARAERPDIAAWQAGVDRFWKVIERELQKLERQAATRESIDPKRLQAFLATLRDARGLLQDKDRKDDPRQEAGPQSQSLLERLAAAQQQTAAQPAKTNPPPTTTTEVKTTSEPERDQARSSNGAVEQG